MIVSVTPAFLPEQSDAALARYVFTYRITIDNQTDSTIQILRRHWLVVDADGRQRVVDGEGVVGAKPVLAPGETFTYESWCPLETPWGTMEGEYTGMADGERPIRVQIARFYLVASADAELPEGSPERRR